MGNNIMKDIDNLAFKKGMKDAIPIGLGYFGVSFTLGIAAKNAGLTWFEASIMSLFNNTSAGEFAALDLISKNVPYLELALTQIIINLRYLLMSCALSQKLNPKIPIYQRMIIGFDITDEIFGISIAQKDELNPYYSYGAMLTSIPGWALGTCFGVILGNVLSENVVSALSVALYAMFIAIIIPPTKDSKIMMMVVIVSMFSSLIFDYIPYLNNFSSGMKIILLTIIISLIFAIKYPHKENENAS